MTKKHAFVILAYKESLHLQECIDSLKKQTIASEIVICTSTPSPFLDNMAQKNNLPLFVNSKRDGIAADWNFALSHGEAQYVTLAHQDDIYFPDYAEKILEAAASREDALIIFSDYNEIVDTGQKIFLRERSLNFFIKRTVSRLFFRNKNYITASKKRFLALGSPIGCPAVTYQKSNIGDFEFDKDFSINLDWKAWYDLAQKDGSFVWVKKTLVSHRIYSGSETSLGLAENRRQKDDLKMFRKFWPAILIPIINKIYSLSYKSNNN